MAQLPLRTRRLYARGMNARHVARLGGRRFIGIGNRATLQAGGFFLMAKTPVVGGNSITFTVTVTPGTVAATATGSAITLTAPSGTTMKTALRAMQASPAVMALVWPRLADHTAETAAVSAVATTSLAGAV